MVIKESKIQGLYPPGTVAKYQCKRTHRLVGSRERVCLESGEWDGFKTKCVKRKLFQMIVKCDAYVIGSLIWYNKIFDSM